MIIALSGERAARVVEWLADRLLGRGRVAEFAWHVLARPYFIALALREQSRAD